MLEKLRRRIEQLLYLASHPIDHWRITQRLRTVQSGADRYTRFKYLGNYLALGMRIKDRGRALNSHYKLLDKVWTGATQAQLRDGIVVWERQVSNDQPPLRIILETARASREGELRLRFTFRSELFKITFLLSDGEPFQTDAKTVLFVGGAQGGSNCREETREASKHNGEIAPSVMLLMAVQELAKLIEAEAVIAVRTRDQLSSKYASTQMQLDYDSFWISAGAILQSNYFRLPLENLSKSLSDLTHPHRRRTQRKGKMKAIVRAEIRLRLARLSDK